MPKRPHPAIVEPQTPEGIRLKPGEPAPETFEETIARIKLAARSAAQLLSEESASSKKPR